MRKKLKDYLGSIMSAVDGEIGKVSDFYFDDNTWSVLYFVVEAGDWLGGRKLLISPQALSKTDRDNVLIPVDLTREKIQTSPEVDTEKPISRQYEMDLYSHFHWSEYWSGGNWPGGMGTVGMITTPALPFEEAIHQYVAHEEAADYPIRSMNAFVGTPVSATDGHVGDLYDIVVDDRHWTITLLLVEGGQRLPEKKFALLPGLIADSGRASAGVSLIASIQQVQESPEFNSKMPDGENYEAELENYYQRYNS
jgi:sporulation protein YlmC with PRC-barrel domain